MNTSMSVVRQGHFHQERVQVSPAMCVGGAHTKMNVG